jgi:fatty acid desaturase
MARDERATLSPASLGLDRAQWRALVEPRLGPTLLRVGLLFGLWLGLAAGAHVAEPWWAKALLWAASGFFVNGIVQLGHETWHHNLFRGPRANVAFGHFLGWLVGISYEPMRHDHLMHHKFNRTARDPDAYNAGKPSVGTWLRFYAVAFVGLPLAVPFFNILYPLVHMDARRRRRHWWHLGAYVALHAALWAGVVALDLWPWARDLWLVPLLCASPYNGLKSIADHHANVWEGDRYHTATTVRSNAFVTYFWSGLNHHLDHHLFPRVPGPHLPRLHALLRPRLEAEGAPVFDSYAKVFWDALRAGPTYTEQDHFLRAPSERP